MDSPVPSRSTSARPLSPEGSGIFLVSLGHSQRDRAVLDWADATLLRAA